jgi:hypothetical protein
MQHETNWNTVKINGSKVVPAHVCARIEQERDAALRELSKIFHIVSRSHPDGFIQSLGYAGNVERCIDRILEETK